MRAVGSQIFGHGLKQEGLSSGSNLKQRKGVPVGRGGTMHGDAPWVATASPELRSGRYGARQLGFISSKWSEGKGILTLGFLTMGWAPRRLTVEAGFIHLLGSVHGFYNGPPTKVREPTGAAASPRAHWGLQLWRVAAKIGGTRRQLGQKR
jgi:hypothetical protein